MVIFVPVKQLFLYIIACCRCLVSHPTTGSMFWHPSEPSSKRHVPARTSYKKLDPVIIGTLCLVAMGKIERVKENGGHRMEKV